MVEKWIETFYLPPEMEFMISLAAGGSAPVAADGMDWQRFETLVSKNRIKPLVAAGVKKLPQEMIQQHIELSRLLDVKNKYTLFTMQQMQLLAFVMSDLEAHGIRALSLKGPLLAVDLYGNPEMRYSHDLDILVSEADFEKACERLEAGGFQEEIKAVNKTPKRRRIQEKQQGIIHRKYFRDNFCIELHWKISHRWDEPFDALWERRSRKILLGKQISCLGDLDNLSYLICHAAAHGYMRLRWLLDLHILLSRPGIDWSALYDDMVQKGIQNMLLETLILLYGCSVFSMPPIENQLFAICRENGRVKIRYTEKLQSDYEDAYAMAKTILPVLSMTDEEREKSALIRRYSSMLPVAGKKRKRFELLVSFFQPAPIDLERFDFPDSLYFLYYIVRPFYRLWRMTPFYHS